ncbi:unnamed protein product [Dibothriocephalus latus]|uniref:Uncharacterized protein n=1 Tax=Dibothriocephalus latus TaxID=60516 RepID=A0A3P7L1C0_DIBLA|nr:unnamed protein product [Dibothriocephalus latus]
MNLLPAVLCYIAVCLGLFILYICRHSLLCGPVWCLLEQCFQRLRLFVPLRLRILCGGVLRWCFYEKHCLFQIVYLLLVFIAHVVLVRDVLPLLYTYAWMENHILVGLMCLFANILMYLAVCLKDPGMFIRGFLCMRYFHSSLSPFCTCITPT